MILYCFFFFFQAEDGIRDLIVTGVQTCALPICAFTAAIGVDELDASVLLLPEIGLVEAGDPRFVSTVDAIERELLRGKHVMRYACEDDFGVPESAFLICRFWLIDA